MQPASNQPPKSPFFQPSEPTRELIKSPGGTHVKRGDVVDKEKTATLLSTTGNMINSIIGAGVVGIPFALQQIGMVPGILMLLLVAVMTEKSLRLLIGTAKHIDVPSYEMLSEACFGKPGFIFLLMSMFIMSYGANISYLMIIKELLPALLGLDPEDENMKCIILVLCSVFVMFPLSSQRDMADLAKTSNIAVVFDCIIVAIVIFFAPISSSIESSGGLAKIISNSKFDLNTFFIGLGVLSFAFVCQHSSFIIAGSLERPTQARWAKVTSISLIVCGVLDLSCGIFGFLAFQDQTNGNVLQNFQTLSDPHDKIAAAIACSLLCTTMIFVYPMDVFVTRHVTVVLFFQGRRAHEGDDHSVLARTDRRLIMTFILIVLSLVPALLCKDLGPVLAITGAVGGSCVSYIGPGITFLGVHGREFLKLVGRRWRWRGEHLISIDLEEPHPVQEQDQGDSGVLSKFWKLISWYLFLMPFWCCIASIGEKKLSEFKKQEALKSPHTPRLGKVKHKPTQEEKKEDDEMKPLVRSSSFPEHTTQPQLLKNGTQQQFLKKAYGTVGIKGSTDRAIAAAIAARSVDVVEEEDPQDNCPSWSDFLIAIGFICFGIVAGIAGLIQVFKN